MSDSLLTTLPTPLTDAFPVSLIRAQINEALHPKGMSTHGGKVKLDCSHVLHALALCSQLERDCMTLALRMYAMDTDMNAPETNEVLERWRPRVEALLQNQMIDNATLATVPR